MLNVFFPNITTLFLTTLIYMIVLTCMIPRYHVFLLDINNSCHYLHPELRKSYRVYIKTNNPTCYFSSSFFLPFFFFFFFFFTTTENLDNPENIAINIAKKTLKPLKTLKTLNNVFSVFKGFNIFKQLV